MNKTSKAALFALLLVGSFLLGQRFSLNSSTFTLSAPAVLDMSSAEDVWQIIQKSYLRADDIDQDQVKYGLARGLMGVLGDPHSAFLDPDESEAFMTSLKGDLHGIGAELKLEDGLVLVVSPLPDSPAERAGIMPGDIIMKVDGQMLGNVSNLFEVVMNIRGEKGTQVVLTVLHENQITPVDIAIIRDEIHLESVKFEEKTQNSEKIAFIKLSSFTEEIGSEFEDILTEVVNNGYNKLVLDLRFNGGGFLEGAIDILSHFVPEGEVAVKTKRKGSQSQRVSKSKDVNYTGEIVVLVNDSSASASEIVAGALQDYGLAHVLGVKTFGKGSVQEVLPLNDGSLIRITIAEWLTPKDRSIDGVGVDPDEVLIMDYEAYKTGEDNQLRRALEYLGSK
ncbi:MAG: S41 family peptidase [Candidatus Gracilibacteria bacterium]|nr:S41 family peptidase [Candidatus Gracilibacteria bacterium]